MLKVRPEVLGVIKDLCAVLLVECVALGGRVWSTVHNRAAERSGVDVVVHHLYDETTRHGVKDLLCVGVGVTLWEHNLLDSCRPKELGSLKCSRLDEPMIKEDSAAVIDGDCLPEDRDRPVINLDFHLVIGRRGVGGGAGGV